MGAATPPDRRPLTRPRCQLELLRGRNYAGATVFRGIMSFGASARVHSDHFLELAGDLPVVVECVETEERIKASSLRSTR